MRVDARVSELLDKLVLTPSASADTVKVRSELARHNPQIRLHRSAEGIWLDANDIDKLELTNVDIEIKWTELAERFFQNRLNAKGRMSKTISDIKQIKSGGKTVAAARLGRVKGFQVLDDHQWVNIACMTLPDSCGLCVFDEQGAGKTVTSIFSFDLLVDKDEVDFALIIAPKSMVSEWPVDFSKFMGDRYVVKTLVGNKQDKRKALAENADVVVTNFETAVAMEQELRARLRKFGSRAILLVDESFFVKNLDARRTQAIRRLREYCGRAYVLCGTPAPNSPIDLVQQFNIVDFGVTFSGVMLPKDKLEAATIVQEVINDRGPFVRHLKSNVLPELHEKKFNRVIVPMQPLQSEYYRNVLNDLVADLKRVDDATFEKNRVAFLARRSTLLQICSNPAAVAREYDEIPSKFLAIDEILYNLIEEKREKVVLWSFYTATLDALFSRYSKYCPVRYDGTVVETSTRREAVQRFREDDKTMLFIGNPAAAGAGLNLQSARYALYESMSNQAAHYLQSLDRIHRRGQQKQVEYIVLLCEESIEVAEYERLLAKEQSAQKILGDPITCPVSRESMLVELLGTLT